MKILKILFIILTIIWIWISSYLTYIHFSDNSIYCAPINNLSYLNSVNDWSSCDSVLQSSYSKIFNIPVSIFWIFFYITTLIIFLLTLFKNIIHSEKILLFLTSIWVLFSLYFSYLQLFVIDSFCTYCFTSASITVILFLVSLYYFKKK